MNNKKNKKKQVRKIKPFEELTITDDFMFGAVMSDPKRCKKLLEYILGIKIAKLEYKEKQKTIDISYDSKGVRLDLTVIDEKGQVFDIEIQNGRNENLPLRIRYYHDMLDLDMLEKSMDYNKKAFENRCLNIPESGSGVPDILSECRYELEWMLKMQRKNGSVYHKVTTADFAPFVMPEDDTDQLWLYPVSSSATADFCAVCALASGIFAGYDEDFSEKLKNAAVFAYNWLEKNPDPVVFKNPHGCFTGEYSEDDDRDNRYWAAAELLALTGEDRYRDDFLKRFSEDFVGRDHIKCTFDHTHIAGFGSLAYIFGDIKDKDVNIVQSLKESFYGEGYWLADKSDRSGYGASMSEDDYFWGSNMALMKHLFVFVLSYMFTGDERFIKTAYKQISVLLGVNPLGISYVTGIGENCSNFPHLRPACADGIDECIPGMVVGGPNRQLNDEFAKSIIPVGTPPMRCYVDDMMCYSLNEVAIYWNSMTVLALAYFDQQ